MYYTNLALWFRVSHVKPSIHFFYFFYSTCALISSCRRSLWHANVTIGRFYRSSVISFTVYA